MSKKSLIFSIVFVLCVSLIPMFSLPSRSVQAEEQVTNKNFLVYYRAWRDVEMKGVNTSLPDENWISMSDIPYGINIVNVFSYVPPGQEELAKPFFDKLKTEYGPELHARGVKLIRGFDYSKLLTVPHAGSFPTEKEFDDYAKALLDELMIPWGLDGLDIDMETYPSPADVKISDGVIKALSKYIGPKANNGTLFLYDTNAETMAPFENVSDSFDMLAYQQYGSGTDRTEMSSNAYAPYIAKDKFLPGLTFPEEQDRNRWYDTKLPYEESNMYQLAKYVRENDLSGMFLYAFDRDGKTYNEPDISSVSPSNLLWTKTAILEVNGYSVESAKELAKHHLQRIQYSKGIASAKVAELENLIDKASNLYEVNVAILGANFETAISPSYDPILEKVLTSIDLTSAFAAIDEANFILSKVENNTANVNALKTAKNELTNLIGGKKYTEAEVSEAVANLASRIAAVPQPVTAIYQDTNGEKLADNAQLTGKFGESYDFAQKDIPDYTLQEVNGKSSGTFSETAQEVVYIYAKAAPAPVPTVDNGQAVKVVEAAAAVKSPEKVGELPETGDESSNKWLILVGLLAILTSVIILYRKKEKA
ncbi:EndoS/ChiA family endoglycosidase [Listeria cornellensis]|uniref:mannosyl-glycoprotein endo-beta-N-acetylglucosaminidase n=1 Tax=Listeria cornellensis FSL F6-0969 TaxID=1265820 RepID=W7BEE2_9LIST|nr:MucBP domain-containing protein [Listeria cornellensis]EUJ25494.1 family 20 glycosyl hydrolase [Listeria cornellensis FSL F6-0969]